MINLDQDSSTQSKKALHDTNDGAAILGEIAQASNDIGGVQESLTVGSEPGEEAHNRNRRWADEAHDGGPDEEEAHEALESAGSDDDPGPTECGPLGFGGSGGGGALGVGSDGGVEEAGEDAEVGANVFKDRDGVEGGLIVVLGGLENRGVDAEGVGCAAAPLDPYGRGHTCPTICHPPHHHRSIHRSMIEFCVMQLQVAF